MFWTQQPIILYHLRQQYSSIIYSICTPDDGWDCHPKHVKPLQRIKTQLLHLVGLISLLAINNFDWGNISAECERTKGSTHERCFWFDSVKSWSTGNRHVNFHTYIINLPEYVLHIVYKLTSKNMVIKPRKFDVMSNFK